MKKSLYSFEQWCIDNNKTEFLQYWDNELNKYKPNEISSRSTLYVYFKCAKNKHDSRRICLNGITAPTSKMTVNSICVACSSIGQYLLDTYGDEGIAKYWSTKNQKNPFDLRKNSKQKIWWKCQNNPTHLDYECSIDNFHKGSRCPYCAGTRVCHTNSLGFLYPESINKWSDKNLSSPFDYTPGSKTKIWWKCENNTHEDYLREICNEVLYQFKCHACVESNGYRIKDLTNVRFNRLVAKKIDREKTQKMGSVYWLCDCDCGTTSKSIAASHLVAGKIQSCGCLWHEKITGENHYNWKGGCTPLHTQIRGSFEYKEWVKNVYKKDNYTCQCCGKSKNITKNAHHIRSFASHPDLRFVLSNGITLCEECHAIGYSDSFHTLYGTIDNTPEQLEEYINHRRKSLGINIPFNIKEYQINT